MWECCLSVSSINTLHTDDLTCIVINVFLTVTKITLIEHFASSFAVTEKTLTLGDISVFLSFFETPAIDSKIWSTWTTKGSSPQMHRRSRCLPVSVRRLLFLCLSLIIPSLPYCCCKKRPLNVGFTSNSKHFKTTEGGIALTPCNTHAINHISFSVFYTHTCNLWLWIIFSFQGVTMKTFLI